MSVARLSTAAALLALCAGLGAPAAVAEVQTSGTTVPGMLSVADLPAQKEFSGLAQTRIVTPLLVKDYCWDKPLPMKKSATRAFYNDETSRQIWQYVTRMPSASAARAAAAEIRACFSKATFDASPKPAGLGRVRHISYGKFGTGSELSAGNIEMRDGKGMPDSDKQWAVGRDGRDLTVLVFHIETGGKPSKDGWITVAKKAVKRLS